MLPPWAETAFDLILHGELHFRAGQDFDRRMAFISFDNAIEVSLGTYLNLKPIHRNGLDLERAAVQQWLRNYNTKIEFLEVECERRGVSMRVNAATIVWYHGIRNDQYHAGPPTTPQINHLAAIRDVCFWVFGLLFDVPDVEGALDAKIAELRVPGGKPERDPELDKVIDDHFGLIAIGDDLYLPSDLLFGHDAIYYQEIGLELLGGTPRRIA